MKTIIDQFFTILKYMEKVTFLSLIKFALLLAMVGLFLWILLATVQGHGINCEFK